MRRIVQWLVVGAGVLAAWSIAVMTGVMVYEVICRYVLHSPTDWALEISTYLLAASVMLGGAYTLRERAHVGMELVYVNLSPSHRALAARISLTVILMFSVVLVWFGAHEVTTASLINERSLTPLAVPLIYPLSLIPIGGLLLAIQALEMLIRPLVDASAPVSEV